jgi:hypothetical protein
VTYSECVSLALVIQHAKRMRSDILSSVTLLFFPNYLKKGTIFGKKLVNIECVFAFLYNFV